MAFSTASGPGVTSYLANGSSAWASGGGPSAKGLQGGGGEDAGRWGSSEAGEPPEPVSVSWEAGLWALDALRNRAALGCMVVGVAPQRQTASGPGLALAEAAEGRERLD